MEMYMELWVNRALSIALLLIIVLAVLIGKGVYLVYVYWWRPRSIRMSMERQGISGPTPRFVTGNLAEMTCLRESMASSEMSSISHDIVDRILPHYATWSRRYGKRFVFWWGIEPRLTITEPELIKELLSSKHGMSYGKSQLQQQGVKDFIGKGLLMANGHDWAQQRRIVSPAFHLENLKGQMSYMTDSTRSMIQQWKRKVVDGGGMAEIEVSQHFTCLAADIIAKTEFGSSFEQGKRVFEKLGHMQKMASCASRYYRFPITRLWAKRQISKLKDEVESSLQRIVEARRNAMDMGRSCSYGSDLLGLLLTEYDKGTVKKKLLSKAKTRELMDQCKTFFFAGQDTTSSLLTWTTMLLALHPEWQQRARQEVLTVCNGNPPDAQAIPKLKTLHLILNESLRLYTPATLFAKEAFKDMKLGDIDIPKGLSVWIPVLAIHHDKKIWGEDANAFKPERFMGDHNMNQMAFMPFSYGPRKCVGQSFAIMEAKLVLAMILTSFHFTIAPSYRHAPISVLTLKPKHGVQITAQLTAPL